MSDNARGCVHIPLNQRVSPGRSIAVRAHQFLNFFSSAVLLKTLGWQSGHLNQNVKAQKELHVSVIFIAWMAHVGRGSTWCSQIKRVQHIDNVWFGVCSGGVLNQALKF